MPPRKDTKFSTARIKKMMQADEEVGKVAKAAPVLVSKSLELLIGLVVKKASNVARAKQQSTVAVKHLQQAVAGEDTFDFLQEVVGKFVPNPGEEDTVIPSDFEDNEAEDSASDDEAPSKRKASRAGRGRGRGRGRGQSRGRGRGGESGASQGGSGGSGVAAGDVEVESGPPTKRSKKDTTGATAHERGRGRGRACCRRR